VPAGEYSEWLLERLSLKVADEEDHRPAGLDSTEVVERSCDIGAGTAGAKGENLPNDAQDMPCPLAGRDELFHLVGEGDEAHFIVVLNGGKGQESADLGGEFVLGLFHAAEASRSAEVHQEDNRELAFFAEFLDERLAGPRSDVPVDAPDIVTRLVFAHLIELHPPSLEDAFIFAGQDVVHHLGGVNLDIANLLGKFARNHGTLTALKICWIRSSEVFSSASAS